LGSVFKAQKTLALKNNKELTMVYGGQDIARNLDIIVA